MEYDDIRKTQLQVYLKQLPHLYMLKGTISTDGAAKQTGSTECIVNYEGCVANFIDPNWLKPISNHRQSNGTQVCYLIST